MKKLIKKKWTKEFPYLMLGILIILFFYRHTLNFNQEVDLSYSNFGPVRPPMYPFFIWLFRWAGSYQFLLITWVQGLFLFLSLLYTRYWLKKNLQISEFPIFLVCLLAIVTIGMHFQMWTVQSEGLAFPLFVFSFFLFIECFKQFNLKKLISLALVVSILVLTRLQFYYFYALFFLLCAWYLWQRIPFKSVIAAVLILSGSILSTFIIDHGYHYIKHGFFAGAPYSGQLLLLQALYLADNDAANYFSDPVQKAYVQTMITERNAKRLNQDAELVNSFKPSFYEYAYETYNRNYLAIQAIIENTLKSSIANLPGKRANVKSNKMALSIDHILIRNELRKNIIFYFWKFVRCMGGVPVFLFFTILVIAIPFKIIKEKIQSPDVSTLFVGIITLITFLNAGIIALCNPYLSVYFCYSLFMFYCLAAFLAHRVFLQDPDVHLMQLV